MLDPSLSVYRYTNRKTGRVRYATEEDLVRNVEDADAEREKWNRGDKIELAEGLSASEAVAEVNRRLRDRIAATLPNDAAWSFERAYARRGDFEAAAHCFRC